MAQTLQHSTPTTVSPLALGPLTARILSTTSTLSLVHLTLPRHTRGLPLLSNRLHTVTYFVLSGALRFSSSISPSSIRLKHFDASEGEVVTIPPGVIYGFGNGDAEPAEVLCIYSPGEWAGALKELSTTERENWKGVLKSWGCEVLEERGEDEEMEDDEDEEEGEEELTHVPSRLRCMAG